MPSVAPDSQTTNGFSDTIQVPKQEFFDDKQACQNDERTEGREADGG